MGICPGFFIVNSNTENFFLFFAILSSLRFLLCTLINSWPYRLCQASCYCCVWSKILYLVLIPFASSSSNPLLDPPIYVFTFNLPEFVIFSFSLGLTQLQVSEGYLLVSNNLPYLLFSPHDFSTLSKNTLKKSVACIHQCCSFNNIHTVCKVLIPLVLILSKFLHLCMTLPLEMDQNCNAYIWLLMLL